ncbi:hypothetical protein BD779DRAFT_1672615 [Infundibulicybe gibba]|nr:hypothetical protein BD779DRAFT_1672615 [Infundibulicybe gibba]
MPIRLASVPRVDIPHAMNIELTEVEDQICVLFDECTNYLANEKQVTTTCRIAGGWVRDKLLGSQSNDIDIALSDIMGLPFAEHLADFAESKGIHTGAIGKIAQNPDQSKHLETATFKVLGLDIDLVNLRSEEYAESSRIPTVTFGTPLQDALRRDITINSLFYNIHTRSVEDFCEKGLEDLRNGIIRTPLPPRETFQDDPLRVLRCIRFASRFGFTIVPEVEDAAKDPTIQQALVSKVARERAGEEVSKMMNGRDPIRAIQIIHDLSLFHSIFSVIPPEVQSAFSAPLSPLSTSLTAASILQVIINPTQFLGSFIFPSVHPTLLSLVVRDPACIARLYLAATLTPYRGITYQDRKKKTHAAVEYALRESVKLGTQNHYLDGIPPLFAASELLRSSNLLYGKYEGASERVAIGLLLREKIVHNPHSGSHWTTSLLFSLIQELVPVCDVPEHQIKEEEVVAVITRYNAFVSRIEELNLSGAGDAKPLLDGREVVTILGATKPGVWTGRVLARVMEWQLGIRRDEG